MALELYYTSSPRGLRPGTSGLCTVAMTRSMSVALASRLESLCGYRPPGEGVPLDRWPAALSHWTIDVGGVERHVLAAVRPVKPDHTMRSNTLAHFAVLHNSELDAAGAAWMLSQPETSAAAWSGEPRLLDVERAMPRGGPEGVRACHTWKSVAGDAGWAGVLANAAMLDPTKPATVIYPMGTRALDLIAEAMSLLPSAYRWRVTFTTYFTQPIAGVRCTWWFCLDGTSAAAAARQAGGLVIDACAPQACTRTGEFVDAAREGREPVLVAAPAQQRSAAKVASGGGTLEGVTPPQEIDAITEGRRRVPARRPVGVDELPAATAPQGRTALAVAVVAAVVLLAIVAVLAVMMRTLSLEAAALDSRAAQAEKERDAMRASSGAAADLATERDDLRQQLSSASARVRQLEDERQKMIESIEELKATVRRISPADAPAGAPDAPANPAPQPPASPPQGSSPSEGAGTDAAGDAAAANAGDAVGAAPLKRDAALGRARAVRAHAIADRARTEDAIPAPGAPPVTAMKDHTVAVDWPAVQGCGATTVALSTSPALESLGFVVQEGQTLAFGGHDKGVAVARAAISGAGIDWTWIHTGVQRVDPDLKAAGLDAPEGWLTVLGQVRMHAMCADGIERTALLGQPRTLKWSITGQGAIRFDVKIPRALGRTPAIEWDGNVVDVSEAESGVETPAGVIRTQMARPSGTTAQLTLEWTPAALEQAEIDCVRDLESAIRQERDVTGRVDGLSAMLDPKSQPAAVPGRTRDVIMEGFAQWQSERTAALDKPARESFERQPLDARLREYRSSLDAGLSTLRQDLASKKSACDEASRQWHDALRNAVVVVRPERHSPPLARIELSAARKVPSLPFAAASAGARAAP